ncbi:MAG: phosphatidylcholine/phosphatidylserine synthase [Planctomycetota bacterium]
MTAPRLDDYTGMRRRRRLRDLKNVPVLPSLVTLGNVFFGFLAIAKVADALRMSTPGAPFTDVVGLFELAAVLIFVAMVFDALDGRIARMTGQTTPFGAQLDSMADMVTFGVTPAFLGKVLIDWHAQANAQSLLSVHPKLYYGAAAIYVLCAALRLARFNVETGPAEEDHREFRGLPSPAAAAVVASLVALYCTRSDSRDVVSRMLFSEAQFGLIVVLMPLVLVTLGLLMVSRVPYPHAVSAIVRGRHSFPFLAGLVVLIGIAAVEWQLALSAVTIGYVLWGVGLGMYRLVTTGGMDRRRAGGDDDDDDDDGEFDLRPRRN